MELLIIDIEYNGPTGEYKLDTNVREEYVNDLLETWIQGQAGRGKDTAKANELDIYHIRITCDLSYDTFRVRSDTGNKSLTCGIIMAVLSKRLGND